MNNLIQGRWDFDLWRVLVAPMLLKKRSSQFMETMTPLEAPSNFFTDGNKLRLGSSDIQKIPQTTKKVLCRPRAR